MYRYSKCPCSLPPIPSSKLIIQLESYYNQSDWNIEAEVRKRMRDSNEDLRRTKCLERYRAQFADGPATMKQLCKAFHIQKQSVKLKMNEYVELGFAVAHEDGETWTWIKK